jgi:hypothetical protein
MKTRWDDSDLSALAWKPLPFAPEDIFLINCGLAKRAARASARLAADTEMAQPAVQ